MSLHMRPHDALSFFRHCLLLIVAALVMATATMSPAQAQMAAPLSAVSSATSGNGSASAPAATVVKPEAPLSEEQRRNIEALLQTLKDEKTRTDFLRNLETLVTVTKPVDHTEYKGDWLGEATHALGSFSTLILELVSEIHTLPQRIWHLFVSLSDPTITENITWAGLMVLVVLAAALSAERIITFLLRRPRHSIETWEGHSLIRRILLLALYTVLDVLPIVAFAVVAFGVLTFTDLPFAIRLATLTIINASLLDRITIAASRALLAPEMPRLRLIPIGDESAAYCFLWARRFAHTFIYGYFLLRAAWLLGLSTPAFSMMLDLLAFILAGMMIVFVLQVQKPVARRLRNMGRLSGRMEAIRNRVANFWHLLAIVYIIAVFIIWVLHIEGGTAFIIQATLLSLLALLVARLMALGLFRVFRRVFRLNDELRAEFPALEARANRYVPVLKQGVSIFISFITLLILLEIWGIGPFEWLASTDGQALMGRVISILLVATLALIVWEIGMMFAARMYERHQSSTRMMTLLPFLQNAFRVILITISSLIVLSELGVDIAPLLAGAGVLGLAIGFGAQTLVKDVITGIFILMEDTLSVGDFVQLGSHAGTVEKISIRTVHLRDFDGNVHSLPFGEVQVVQNMSKHFAHAVVDVAISYRENADEAMAVMEEVAAELARDRTFAPLITAPFEMFGVEALRDSAVWLRGRFRTMPLSQWQVRREYYRRIKAAFDARGIQVPFPHQTLYFGVDKSGHVQPLHVVNEDTSSRPAPEEPTTKRPKDAPAGTAEQQTAPEAKADKER
ncbi:mechanosensitive ion channel family protein [Xanthobacter sp. TB0139]|uniref:mechanosensitive ion channel family protein n=1 Tax=Xanthobacter sp. TB0139 TaxID=3459178 RepID=UPI004039C6C0